MIPTAVDQRSIDQRQLQPTRHQAMPENHKAMTENAAPAPGSAALLDPRLPRVWQVRRPHARLLAEARVHNAGGKGTEAAGASGAGGERTTQGASVMLADAGTPAVLAPAPLAVVRAHRGASATTAGAPASASITA